MIKIYSFLFFVFAFNTITFAAEIGKISVPNIINYSKNEYKGGTQNWALAQDKKGFIYIANNNGLMIFDGVNWQLKQMPNFSVTRSVYAGKDGQIYVGAFNEFGKLIVSKNGQLEFSSFKKFIPEGSLSFDDIWNITAHDDKYFFQAYNYAFSVENDSIINVIKAPSKFQNIFKVDNRLYFNDMSKGLMEYKSGDLFSVPGFESIIGEELAAILQFTEKNSLIICTLDKGIFIFDGKELKPWNVQINSAFRNNQIYSAELIQNNFLAIGTIQDGLFIIDKNGDLVYHINRNIGLQNNTILKIFVDSANNIWLGLDNGIDYININSQVSFIKHAESIGAGYAAIKFEGKIYLGTNQGLYVKSWDNKNFKEEFSLIQGTNGQVWSLGVFNEMLICGHNNGTFIIDDDKVKKIGNIQGAWKYIQLKRYPGYLIGGNYDGLSCYKIENNELRLLGKIEGFNESSRIFEEDELGNIWMSHGYKGIYKLQLEDDLRSFKSVKHYTANNGLPSSYNLNVFKIKGKIIVSSKNGIYEYNKRDDSFESSSFFNQIFHPKKSFSYLKEDSKGNIWYNSEENGKNVTGVYQVLNDQTYKNISSPFALLTNKFINGFESISVIDDGNIFIGIEEGFANYSPSNRIDNTTNYSTYIRRATALYLDSVFFFGNYNFGLKEAENQNYEFPFNDNSFRFSYSSPQYENQINIEYSYKLSSYNEKWSEWSGTSYCEFANLEPGNYVFHVKSRNQTGVESTTDSIAFKIAPPWYLSIYFKLLYILLIIALIGLSLLYFYRRIEISKRKERLKHLKEYRQKEQDFKSQALQAEKKIVELKNERLRIEMIHRDKELANQTMSLIKKNKFLVKLKEELEKIKQASSDELQKSKISSLITKINKDIDQQNQWEVFETAFDEVHDDFMNRLKTLYPNLTPKELKLCAFLRMNISTKEIAPLMNISVRGVEICRYRVRKKLNIDRDQNLTSMIIDL